MDPNLYQSFKHSNLEEYILKGLQKKQHYIISDYISHRRKTIVILSGNTESGKNKVDRFGIFLRLKIAQEEDKVKTNYSEIELSYIH